LAYLDTHVAVWLAAGQLDRISRKAQRMLESATLILSPAVLLELEYLFEFKRTKVPARDLLRKLEHEIGLTLCDLPCSSVAFAALDEKWTRDPFDRLIVAHAKANGLAHLISADEEIAEHYQCTVW
jgi:PIN domain nuclease of toxin-antitoxin system